MKSLRITSTWTIAILVWLLASKCVATDQPKPDYIIPNAKTAVEIAQVVLYSAFDHGIVRKLLPLNAVKQGNVWIVRGQISKKGMTHGGSVLIKMSETGGILELRYEM